MNSEMEYGNVCSMSSEALSLKITWKIPEYLSLSRACNYLPDSSAFNFANATWYLQLDPNERQKMSISLIRSHSLMKRHKINCMFDILKRNGEYLKDKHEYRPLKFCQYVNDPEFYYIDEIPNSPELLAAQELLTQDGTLVLIGHLLFEESTGEKLLTECNDLDTNINERAEMKQSSGILSLTYSKIQSLKITWKVPNYLSILENKLGYSLKSPSFDFGYATWFLKLYPVGVEENESDTGLSIVRSSSIVPLFHELIFTQDLITEGDKPFSYNFYLNNVYKKNSFAENSEMKEYRHFFDTRWMLVDILAVDDDGNVTFLIHTFYEDVPLKEAAIQKMRDELDMYRNFGGDMKNFLLNGNGHDLVLKVKEKEFRVHRQILSARSPVFESMLIHDMAEKNCGVVSIPDCDPPVMEQFLLYVYCGKMDSLDETNMLGLYYVADKYNMIHLKEVCRGFIRKSVSSHNVCDIVQLAMNHCDEDLKELATEFIVKNKDEILTTADWVSFKNEHKSMANEILSKASGKASFKKQKIN